MTTTTWHNRLESALIKRGKDWSDLVTATGLTRTSVYAWKPWSGKRSNMMNGDHAAVVCAFLAINPLWLFHNRGPSGLEKEQPKPIVQIPNAAEIMADLADIELVFEGYTRDLSEQIREKGKEARRVIERLRERTHSPKRRTGTR